MIKVVVLGSGNVATHLCVAFEKNPDVLLLQNYNRKGASIANCGVPITNNKNEIKKADTYIFALSDSTLSQVQKEFGFLKGIIVHTSGSTPMEAFSGFENYGVFYPVQSFVKEIPIDFSTIPIAVEAKYDVDKLVLLRLAKSISQHVYNIDSKQRNALHIAAVFANNFSNFMFTQAAEICNTNGIDFEILKPLIFESIQKLKQANPKDIQTGPAIRNDQTTIERHITTLKDPKQIKLYQTLTTAIKNYYE